MNIFKSISNFISGFLSTDLYHGHDKIDYSKADRAFKSAVNPNKPFSQQ